MRDCPKCSAQVDGVTCQRCGYSETKKANGKDYDPESWRCCDTDLQGNRCAKPGALSDSTHGSGPWYCRQHYPAFQRGGGRTEPPMGWHALRSIADCLPQPAREPGSDDA